MTLTAKQEAFLQIKQLSVDDLIPYAKNSRTHSAEQVAQIAASIREFGFTNPVLIDSEGGIIAGHGRVQAARKLGMTEVPCIMLDNLTELQKQAYIIADNKLALNAGWDDELLKIELQDLHAQDFDMGLLGFDAQELSEAMGLDDVDEVEKDIDSSDKFQLLIEYETESQLQRAFDEIKAKGLTCKIIQ